MKPPFEIGDRVRHGGRYIMRLHDYWNAQGRHAEKVSAREALDYALGERGTVRDCKPGKYAAWIVTVEWDTGSTVEGLPECFERDTAAKLEGGR